MVTARLTRRPIGGADLRSDLHHGKACAMSRSEPNRRQLSQLYRPLCSKCGTLSILVRVEPSPEPDHDLRTFECPSCGETDVITMKFK
jgi:predicted RNA-binding Zn-ribbon protein involved in translation (DUF1610 family)